MTRAKMIKTLHKVDKLLASIQDAIPPPTMDNYALDLNLYNARGIAEVARRQIERELAEELAKQSGK